MNKTSWPLLIVAVQHYSVLISECPNRFQLHIPELQTESNYYWCLMTLASWILIQTLTVDRGLFGNNRCSCACSIWLFGPPSGPIKPAHNQILSLITRTYWVFLSRWFRLRRPQCHCVQYTVCTRKLLNKYKHFCILKLRFSGIYIPCCHSCHKWRQFSDGSTMTEAR